MDNITTSAAANDVVKAPADITAVQVTTTMRATFSCESHRKTMPKAIDIEIIQATCANFLIVINRLTLLPILKALYNVFSTFYRCISYFFE